MGVLESFWDIVHFLFPELTTELLPPLFRTVFEVSLTMTAVIGLLLLLRPLFKKHYRAGWMYWVWLLVALRLVVPLNLSLPEAPVSLTPPSTTLYQVYAGEGTYRAWEKPEEVAGVNRVIPPKEDGGASAEAPHTPVARIYTLSQVVVLVWSMGICAVLLWEFISYARFRRRVRRWRSTESDEILLARFEALKAELGVKRLVLAQCSAVSSPTVTGFVHPTLLLPEIDVPEVVLRHELVHAKRHDLWYKLLLVVVRAVHWFNPLVWIMSRQAGQDLELSCDETVVAGRDESFRAGYGRAILSAMERGQCKEQAPLTTYFHSGKRAMLERLQSIVNAKAKRRGMVALGLAVVLTVSASALCTISPPTQRVDGGLYTLSIPTDIISCSLTEVMPDDTFPTSYYQAHFWRYSGSGNIRRLSVTGFADMSLEARAEALQPTDKALGEFEFLHYLSPGGLEGMEARSASRDHHIYFFPLGGDGVLEFSLYLGSKGTGHQGAYFTQAEADAMLASLMIGGNQTSSSKGTYTLSASYLNTKTQWLVWDTSKQNPVLLDTVNIPARPLFIGGVIWSQDGNWAAVPTGGNSIARDFRVLGVHPDRGVQDISTLFSLESDPASLFAASGVTLDYTPVPETLELHATDFVENPFPHAELPAIRVSYSWRDTAGGLQSGSFTYPCEMLETSYRPENYTPLTDIEQNAPCVPTQWSDEIHTFSLPLPKGTAVSPADAQGVRAFTGPGGEYLGRIYQVEKKDARNQSYKAHSRTISFAWLDGTDGPCYQLEICETDLPRFISARMAEQLTMDGQAINFYYENQIIN